MEPGEYARMDAVEAEMWWYRALHARLLNALAPVRGRVMECHFTGVELARRAVSALSRHSPLVRFDACAYSRDRPPELQLIRR